MVRGIEAATAGVEWSAVYATSYLFPRPRIAIRANLQVPARPENEGTYIARHLDYILEGVSTVF
jgi:hypothetical protein